MRNFFLHATSSQWYFKLSCDNAFCYFLVHIQMAYVGDGLQRTVDHIRHADTTPFGD